jgi:hypothetical protein
MLPSLMLLRMRVYALSRGDARIDAVVVVVVAMELVEVMLAVAMAVLAFMVVVVVAVLAEMVCWSMSSVCW